MTIRLLAAAFIIGILILVAKRAVRIPKSGETLIIVDGVIVRREQAPPTQPGEGGKGSRIIRMTQEQYDREYGENK